MRAKYLLLFLALFWIGALQASTTQVSLKDGLNELRAHTDQRISVRGFLYQKPDGIWVLASEPNLKSCCVGAAHKVESQIFITFSSIPNAVPLGACCLEGDLRIEESRVVLSSAALVPEDGGRYWVFFTPILLLGIGALFWRVRKT